MGKLQNVHDEFGKIPRYLRERQLEAERELERKKEEEAKAKEPKGMVRMPEDQRQETLAVLKVGLIYHCTNIPCMNLF